MSFKIINGDCREILKTLTSDSFDCVVTSPPYWGLRDYGVAGQIGLEPTMQEYLATIVDVFRELRRVLKPDGTCWLNIGDCYNKKSLAMIPNRLAILLQEDGWYVRSEIIWHKPNPMPESVRDRPTSAHEKVWLLTKSDRYFYDADAIKEKADPSRVGKGLEFTTVQADAIGRKPSGNQLPENYKNPRGEFKNARNVWTITPKPYKGAHFATMPPDLAERCIKAGCPVGGMVLDPFGGAGTTGVVAEKLGRHAALIELNNQYVQLANDRIVDNRKLI